MNMHHGNHFTTILLNILMCFPSTCAGRRDIYSVQLFFFFFFFYLLPFLIYKGPKRAKTRLSVECKLAVKHITLLVKHIITSNILLCQASTRSIFIFMYSSVVNMLRSYHAALAKPLSSRIKKNTIILPVPHFLTNIYF